MTTRAKAVRVCAHCSAEFRPWSSTPKQKFCSVECRDASMRTIPDSECGVCGMPVKRASPQRKFCSHACYAVSLRGKASGKDTRISLRCERCGTEKLVKAYRLGEFKYCSRTCFLEAHSENNTTPELDRLRRSAQYRAWRTAVFERDNYTCVLCGDHNHTGRGAALELNADHIKSFAHHPELRFDLDNGRTLCEPCHRQTDNFGFRAWRGVLMAVDAVGY